MSARSLTQLPILRVWKELGGGELRGFRGKAFWRDGDGYNVATDLKKNVWFDFVKAAGGGPLGLA